MKTVVLTPSTYDLPPGWSAPVFRDVAQRAAERWSFPNVPCAVKVAVAEPTSHWHAVEDGTNLLVIRGHTWCHNERCGAQSTFPSRATAMTSTYPDRAIGGAVTEADVEINGVTFQLTAHDVADARAATGKWGVPLEPVLVHEIGHVLGLGDACIAGHLASGRPVTSDCGADETMRVMFPTGLHTTLAPSDVAALCQIYPIEGRSWGTAGLVSAASLMTLAIAVLVFVLRRRARRRPV